LTQGYSRGRWTGAGSGSWWSPPARPGGRAGSGSEHSAVVRLGMPVPLFRQGDVGPAAGALAGVLERMPDLVDVRRMAAEVARAQRVLARLSVGAIRHVRLRDRMRNRGLASLTEGCTRRATSHKPAPHQRAAKFTKRTAHRADVLASNSRDPCAPSATFRAVTSAFGMPAAVDRLGAPGGIRALERFVGRVRSTNHSTRVRQTLFKW
jgi:hypothetical protein